MAEKMIELSDAASEKELWQKRFYWLTGILVVFRLFLSVYLDLTPDESYYWELSRRLDWSYFDHPPMVAWLIAIFRGLLGDSQLHIRLISVLGSAFAGWCLFVAGRDFLHSARTGFVAVMLMNFTPAGSALGFVTTPDTPLVVFWSLAMLAFLKAIDSKKALWWAVTGLALAGGALSKYNMIMFVPGVALTILGFKKYRHLVFTGRYWLMVLLAAIGTLPILYWNTTHDWISFKFQFDHGLSANARTLWHNVGEYLGGQLGTVGLTLFPVMWFVVLRQAFRSFKKNDEIRFILVWLALPSMLFFTWTGLKSKVEANWPQVAYLTAFLLVSDWLVRSENFSRRCRWVAGPSVILALIAVFQSVTLLLPLPPRSDVTVRMHGWRQMGEAIRKLDEKTGRKQIFIVQGTTLATLVGYYGGIESGRFVELYLNGNFRIWWHGRVLPPGTDLIFVDADHHPEASAYAGKFASSTTESHDIYSCGRKIRRINLTRMSGLKAPLTLIPNKVF